MKLDEPIRQHYVPKLYLKRFAIKNMKYIHMTNLNKIYLKQRLKMLL